MASMKQAFLVEAPETTGGEPVDEDRLIEKLRLIEALFADPATEGEKVAAERAKHRILERLQLWEREDPPVEYRFAMGDMWSRKLFVALLRRYDIMPYRYKGQRYTTVMARVSKRFVDETLWPEFLAFDETLRAYLAEVTERVVSQVIHRDSSEAAVVAEPPRLPRAVDAEHAASATSSSSLEQSDRNGTVASDNGDTRLPSHRSRRRKRKKRKRR
jgi:hypothetical protein